MTRRLRICVVTPGFARNVHEPGLAALTDLIGRIGEVHDVQVVALRHPSRQPPYEAFAATVHAQGPVRAVGATGRLRVLLRGIQAVTRLHQRRPFDLIHAFWADEAGAVATLAGRLVRRPTLVSVMGGELVALPDISYGALLGRGGRLTTALSLRLATSVTAGSTFLRDQVVRARPGRDVTLQPLGVDLTEFAPAAATKSMGSQQTVLFVGSLESVKDPEMMLRVFASVAHHRERLRLRMVGDGSQRAHLAGMAGDLGIADLVEFTGQLPRGALPDVYRSASVLCITSRHEAQSMVAVEAAACAVPVVGTRVGVLPDLGAGALTVPIGDEHALSVALARLLDDPRLAGMIGRAGRAAVEQQLRSGPHDGRRPVALPVAGHTYNGFADRYLSRDTKLRAMCRPCMASMNGSGRSP